MTSRERVLAALAREPVDRVPIHDGPWPTTIERWRREGLPEDASLGDLFGYDMMFTSWDNTLRLPERVFQETDDYVVKRDANGVSTRTFKHRTSTPELIEHTITSPQKWAEVRDRAAPAKDRIDLDEVRKAWEESRRRGAFLAVELVFGYDRTSLMVGPETFLPAMITDPDWVRDMFRAWTDMAIGTLDHLFSAGLRPDGAWVYDDLGYRNGLFFSPQMFRDLLKPEHARLVDFLHRSGLPTILHTCGNVTELVGDLVDAGWDCLQPLEVKAGMDLLALKEAYGDRLALMGGIDARKMASPNPADIEEEIRSKIPPAMRGGGYLYHSDHSVPDNVSFEQYKRVMEFVHRYGKP